MTTNRKLKCGKCGIENVRLYRLGGCFFYDEDIRCNKCIREESRIGYVPIRLDTDGSIWGHAAGTQESVDAFYSLPEADMAYPIWQPERMFTKEGWGGVLIHASWSNCEHRQRDILHLTKEGYQ